MYSPNTPEREAPVILLAEDSPDVREMYRLAFELSSFRVIEAGHGVQAVQLTWTHRPDALVMDLAMPRIDGMPEAQS